MWVGHFFFFGLPAVLWPFTYFGSQAVNDFYLLLAYYSATVAGLGVISVTTVLFLMAYASYSTTSEVG